MPGPVQALVIAPIGTLTALYNKWGVDPTANVYTEADAPPRTVTHKARSATTNPTLSALINAHNTSPDPDLPGVLAALWQIGVQSNPYQTILADNGLTTVSNPPS